MLRARCYEQRDCLANSDTQGSTTMSRVGSVFRTGRHSADIAAEFLHSLPNTRSCSTAEPEENVP